MSIDNITRQAITKNVSGAYTAQLEDNQIVCDATSAGFTVTLYKVNDGAIHRLIVAVDPDDVSGNTVTITDGTFSTTLSAAGAAVTLETQYDGSWMIAGEYPVTSSATATSKADSAGLAASAATSAAASLVLTASSVGSTATSQNGSQSLNDSSTGSTATSQNASQSQNVSSAGSVATSQNASQSQNVSTAQSTAAS